MLRVQKRCTAALINEVTSSTDNLIKLFRITSLLQRGNISEYSKTHLN